jgi:hypothetical protein
MQEMHKRMWKPIALTLILSVAVWGASLTKPVHGDVMTTYIAATITGQVGDIRTVTVMAYNVEDLTTLQVFMSWDPTVLEYIGLEFAGLLADQPEGSTIASFTYGDPIDSFMATESQFGQYPGVTAASALLMTVTFKVLSVVDSTITIDYPYTYWIDSTQTCYGDDAGEMIKENGGFISPWPEDINMDGFVDAMDLASVAINYGKGPGDEIVPPEADVNGDGYVDILDLTMVAIKYGQYTGY